MLARCGSGGGRHGTAKERGRKPIAVGGGGGGDVGREEEEGQRLGRDGWMGRSPDTEGGHG
jgi:hypothetical protein